jgi:thiol-disulfide isomerase/thioredoxin
MTPVRVPDCRWPRHYRSGFFGGVPTADSPVANIDRKPVQRITATRSGDGMQRTGRQLVLGSVLAFILLGWQLTASAGTELVTPQQLRSVLEQEQGNVVVLNLWGSWCTPCLKEIPDLVALEQELAERGVVVIGLGMDEPDTLDTLVEPFREKHFPGFRTYLRDAPDMDSVVSIVDPAWNELLPTTYLIDRDGNVVKRIQGKRSREQFRAEIEPLL